MARLRLMVVAVAAVGACGQAGAAPPSGIAAPPGWQAVPALASAAADALGPGVTIDGTEAWAEPAMGCYGVWLAIKAGGEPAAVAAQILDGFAEPQLKLAVRDVVVPAGDGVLALSFERPPYRGRLRARLGNDRIVAVACFANQREPIACGAACDGLLGAVR